VGYGVNGIALLEALRPKRDLPMASRLLPGCHSLWRALPGSNSWCWTRVRTTLI